MAIKIISFVGRRAHYGEAFPVANRMAEEWIERTRLSPSQIISFTTQTYNQIIKEEATWCHEINLMIDLAGDIDEVLYGQIRDKWHPTDTPPSVLPIVPRSEESIRNLIKGQNARALGRGAPGVLVYEEWMLLCEHFDNKCASCGREVPLCMDHVIALARGGTNFIENIQPLCRGCNSGKNAKSTDYRGDRAYSFLEKLELLRNSS